MSYLNCTCNLSENENGGATCTINMDDVTYKCMKSLAASPEEWIHNAVHNRSRQEGDRIYKLELEKHIEAGTMPTNPTKESLILAYEIPVQETSNIA
jgi:hypothetical protein